MIGKLTRVDFAKALAIFVPSAVFIALLKAQSRVFLLVSPGCYVGQPVGKFWLIAWRQGLDRGCGLSRWW